MATSTTIVVVVIVSCHESMSSVVSVVAIVACVSLEIVVVASCSCHHANVHNGLFVICRRKRHYCHGCH